MMLSNMTIKNFFIPCQFVFFSIHFKDEKVIFKK